MLKRIYAKKEDIPEGYEALYKEKDGSFVLIEIDGLKPLEEFENANSKFKTAERELTELRNKYKSIAELDPKDILTNLDKLKELETKGEALDKLDEKKINELVEIRTQRMKRELADLESKFGAIETERDSLRGEKVSLKRKELLKEFYYDKEAKENKVYDGVITDIEIRAERDLEWNEADQTFYTKDDKKLNVVEWGNKQVSDGALWMKGSRGNDTKNSKFKNKNESRTGNTVEDSIMEVWND